MRGLPIGKLSEVITQPSSSCLSTICHQRGGFKSNNPSFSFPDFGGGSGIAGSGILGVQPEV